MLPWKKSYDNYTQNIKKHRNHFADRGLYTQSYGVFNNHICMSELDHKEVDPWRINAFKLVLEKTLEIRLENKEIKPVYPKEN